MKFLENILAELKRSGHRRQPARRRRRLLAGPARAESPSPTSSAPSKGPLADVRGVRPDQLDFGLALESLQRMWMAVRANLRTVLEEVTLADLCEHELPKAVDALADDPDAWSAH